MLQVISLYLGKVIICSGLLTMYYYTTLRNKRFHTYNRFYLLVSVTLCILIPFLNLKWFEISNNTSSSITLFKVINGDDGEGFTITNNSFSWSLFIYIAFLTLSSCLLVKFTLSIIKLYKIKKKYPVTRTSDFDFITTDIQQAPFSFLKNIFWRTDILVDTESGKQILQHEITHVKEKHSWDKLLMQMVLCFYWMNPFFWLLRKELYMVHEFIADEKSVDKNDAASFAKMLLTSQYKNFDFLPAQSIYYSPIKRRLLMLTSSKKTSFSYLRRLMILPLITSLICLFAFSVKKNLPSNNVIAKIPFALVVDAGHGGEDFGGIGNGLNEKDVTLKISNKIKELSSQYNISVILTRNDDISMSPKQKSDFANKQNADAFISIHINSDGKQQSEKSGFEIVVSNNQVRKSSNVLLGSAILQNLKTGFQTAPSLQENKINIWVLKNSSIPAVLIECGYINNNNDAAILKDDVQIESIARKILSGVASFANNNNSTTP